MKNLRILLIGGGILAFVILQVGKSGGDSVALTVILLAVLTANAALAFNFAKKTDRSPVGWAIGGFIAPYVCNVILVLLPVKKSVVMKNLEQIVPAAPVSTETVNEAGIKADTASLHEELFTSFPAAGNVFKIKQGLFKKPFDLNLDNLRLFAIVTSSNVKWRVTMTFATINEYNIDLLPEEDAHYFYTMLEKALMGTQRDCAGITVCLAEYGKKGMEIGLAELRSEYPALLAAVYRLRHQRKERLRHWLAGKAETTIKGSFGTTIVLDKEGYHSGNKITPWSEIGRIRVEVSTVAIMYMLPKGSKGGMFSSWGAKHSLHIPKSKTAIYRAECNFWREVCETV